MRTCWVTLLLLGLAVLSPAQAAISYVASSTSAPSSSTVGSITLTAPAGLTANDLMVAYVTANVSSQLDVATFPSGWTFLRGDTDGSSLGVSVYYRVATGADVAGSTTYAWTLDNVARAAGAILTFRGVSTSSPIVVSNGSVNNNNTNYTAPSLTPGITNTMMVVLYSVKNGNTNVLSTPAGLTKLFEVGTQAGPNGVLIGGFYGALAGAGATGSKVTASGSSINAISIGVSLALRAAAASSTLSFLITNTNYGLYCLSQTVTVTARDSANNPDSTYNGMITLSTTTGRGTWSLTSGGGSFVDATPDDGLATYAFPGNQSAATFALSYKAGPATVTVHAAQSSPTVVNDDGTQSAIVFSPSGFTVTSSPFSNPAGGVPA